MTLTEQMKPVLEEFMAKHRNQVLEEAAQAFDGHAGHDDVDAWAARKIRSLKTGEVQEAPKKKEKKEAPKPPDNPVHKLVFTGCSPHNGEYWYECSKCKKSDWIPSYGDASKLMLNEPCVEKKK